MCICFDTLPACVREIDGRTDGQTDRFVVKISRSACRCTVVGSDDQWKIIILKTRTNIIRKHTEQYTLKKR